MPKITHLFEFCVYCKVGKFLGIVPLKYKTPSIICSWLLNVVMCLWTVASCLERRPLYAISFKTVIILDLLKSGLSLLFLVSLTVSCTWNRVLWNKLMIIFAKENSDCCEKILVFCKVSITCIFFVSLHYFMCFVINESTTVEKYKYSYYIYTLYGVYELFTIMLISVILLMIRGNYLDVNHLIEKYFDYKPNKGSLKRIYMISKKIKDNEDTVIIFNRIFGWTLFFFFGHTLLNILQLMNMTLKHVAMPYGGLDTVGCLTLYINIAYYLVSLI